MGLPFQRDKRLSWLEGLAASVRLGNRKLRTHIFSPEQETKRMMWNGTRLLISKSDPRDLIPPARLNHRNSATNWTEQMPATVGDISFTTTTDFISFGLHPGVV